MNFKLNRQYWFELEKSELTLKDFYAATLLSKGKKISLADWFSTLNCPLREISKTKDHYHDIHTKDDNNLYRSTFKATQMPRGQNAPSTTTTSS
jgi:methenyltetrahydromethanopterin cyclohydrolase